MANKDMRKAETAREKKIWVAGFVTVLLGFAVGIFGPALAFCAGKGGVHLPAFVALIPIATWFVLVVAGALVMRTHQNHIGNLVSH